MTTASVPVPRRGTPARRAWTLRALLIGLFPMATALIGMLSLRFNDMAASGGGSPWTELAGWTLAAIILLGIAAIVALFDRRTRLSAAAALVFALFLNPISASLIAEMFGL